LTRWHRRRRRACATDSSAAVGSVGEGVFARRVEVGPLGASRAAITFQSRDSSVQLQSSACRSFAQRFIGCSGRIAVWFERYPTTAISVRKISLAGNLFVLQYTHTSEYLNNFSRDDRVRVSDTGRVLSRRRYSQHVFHRG